MPLPETGVKLRACELVFPELGVVLLVETGVVLLADTGVVLLADTGVVLLPGFGDVCTLDPDLCATGLGWEPTLWLAARCWCW